MLDDRRALLTRSKLHYFYQISNRAWLGRQDLPAALNGDSDETSIPFSRRRFRVRAPRRHRKRRAAKPDIGQRSHDATQIWIDRRYR
jgi:hypothetical protein